jgi:hypothetical protein
MSSTYRFSYRRRLFWRTFVVIGSKHEPQNDKMVLFFPDGGLREIARWSRCEARLGADWVAAMKKQMEAQAGQSIPLKV